MEDAPGLADGFYLIEAFVANARWMNFVSETPVFARYCLETDTAEVYAEVTSDRPLGRWFNVGNYDIGKVTVGGTAAVPANVTFGKNAVAVYDASDVNKPTQINFTFGGFNSNGEYKLVYTLAGISVEHEPGVYNDPTGNAIAEQIAMKLGIGTTVTIDGVKFTVNYNATYPNTVYFTEVGAPDNYTTKFNGKTPIFTAEAIGTAGTAGTTVVEFREANHPIGKGKLIAVIPLGGSDLALDVLDVYKRQVPWLPGSISTIPLSRMNAFAMDFTTPPPLSSLSPTCAHPPPWIPRRRRWCRISIDSPHRCG